MPSHPDADAFMRNYLRTPHDTTARLVFADWLEETGRRGNVAWAYYIRAMADADRHPPRGDERRRLAREAAGYARNVRARLTIPAALFVGYPKSLLHLLPAPNITVRLDGYEVPQAARELVPESVARENLILPLGQQTRVLLIAAADPRDHETIQKLQFILNRDVVAVRAAADDVMAAIDRHYTQADTEWAGGLVTEFVDVARFPPAEMGLPDPARTADAPVVRVVNLILTEAFAALGADAVRITPGPDGVVVRYRVGGAWVDRDRLPARLGPPVATRLAIMAGIYVGLLFEPQFAAITGPIVGGIRLRVRGVGYTVRADFRRGPDTPAIDLELVRDPEPVADRPHP